MDLDSPSTSKSVPCEDEEKIDNNLNESFESSDTPEHEEFDVAKESRLTYNELSSLEKSFFPNVNKGKYLYYRNFILTQWHNEPSIELVFEDVKDKLDILSSDDINLVSAIFKFLRRYCFINYGIFNVTSLPVLKYKVIVIGAGIAGLAAARQLKYFGFDVIVLEATNRIGGRLYSFNSQDFFIDLGCSFVNSQCENPIRTLVNQLNLSVRTLHSNRKLFLDGDTVNKKKDKVSQNMFLNLINMALVMCDKHNLAYIGKEQVSLEAVIDQLLYLGEVCSLLICSDFLSKKFNVKENININIFQLEIMFDLFLKQSGGFNIPANSNKELDPDKEDQDADFYCSNGYNEEILEKTDFSGILDGHIAYLKSIALEEKFDEINKKFEDFESDKLKNLSEFLSAENSRILNWYFASLEYLLGAPLADISLRWFAHEDLLEHSRPQYYFSDGYTPILEALTNKHFTLDIETGVGVKSIQLFNDHVKIEAEKNGTLLQLNADAVLCTIPLGVLKKSVTDTENEESFPNKIRFIPPLPEDKVGAIKRLGCATINKVVLCFDKKFWENGTNLFGNVGLTKESRGELFMFFSLSEQPVLIGIMCGKSLDAYSKIPDDIVVSRCLNILKEIFDNVPCPNLSCVSRWDTDPFFMGTHSFVSTKTLPDDYEVVAKPVRISDHLMPRLFFAGEHTNRKYPSSVHGAFLSGLREASIITNCFLGSCFNQ